MRHILDKRFWVFDLDGTLTIPVHDFVMIRATLGIPDGADILSHLDSLPGEEAQPRHDWLENVEMTLAAQTNPAPGACELVEFLFRRECRLGILTRNKREIAFLTLKQIGLDSYFAQEDVLGRDEALPKPDADGIRKLASSWDTCPEELVVVGDYLHDLVAGHAAGAATIHVLGGRTCRWPEWTDLCVESLSELSELTMMTLQWPQS